jgi:hypothetical protein
VNLDPDDPRFPASRVPVVKVTMLPMISAYVEAIFELPYRDRYSVTDSEDPVCTEAVAAVLQKWRVEF